jgi:hypothetical protein
MLKLARALALGAMVAAIHLAGPAAAHAQAGDRQIETASAQRRAAAEASSGDATVRRLLARERFAVPTPATAQEPGPTSPAGPPPPGLCWPPPWPWPPGSRS